MDRREYQPKNFGFTREVKSSNSRKVHPNDDENNPISNRPTQSVSETTHHVHFSSYHQLLHLGPTSVWSTSQFNTDYHSNQKHPSQDHHVRDFDRFFSSLSSASFHLRSALASISNKGLLLAAGIIGVIVLITVLPSVLGVILTRNPNGNSLIDRMLSLVYNCECLL